MSIKRFVFEILFQIEKYYLECMLLPSLNQALDVFDQHL